MSPNRVMLRVGTYRDFRGYRDRMLYQRSSGEHMDKEARLAFARYMRAGLSKITRPTGPTASLGAAGARSAACSSSPAGSRLTASCAPWRPTRTPCTARWRRSEVRSNGRHAALRGVAAFLP